jgi:5-methylcytosine-specific restriction protein A
MPISPPSLFRKVALIAAIPSAFAFQRLPDVRPDSNKRGYTRKWKKFARIFLAQHPLCVNCECNNRTVLATLVDHITPVTDAGELDPNFYAAGNHQALCRRCHAVKTADDTRKGLNR